MNALFLKPGDMLEIPAHVGTHLYHVSGVHLGTLGQESLVELVPLDQTRGGDPKPKQAFVPLAMIEAGCDLGIFNHSTP